jgi:hypothetical protein
MLTLLLLQSTMMTLLLLLLTCTWVKTSMVFGALDPYVQG